MSKIISIGKAVPAHCSKQSDILLFMQNAFNEPVASRKLSILFHSSGISNRHSVLTDFAEGKNLFFKNNGSTPNVDKRLDKFRENALPLALEAYKDAIKKTPEVEITHLIVVTCTGMYSPSLDSEIIESLNLRKDIFHLQLNFGGCSAAFPALKVADLIVTKNPEAKVMVVCIELCTLHFQTSNNNDMLLANTIFGDGAAAAIVAGDNYYVNDRFSLKIDGFYSFISSQGKKLMEWNITSNSFEMVLDSNVPDYIGEEIEKFLANAGTQLNFDIRNIDKWAVHPGGKRILDNIKKSLNLPYEALLPSYSILNNYGNMSSPTILFVLDYILNEKIHNNEKVIAIGFGPGLTFETALFTYKSGERQPFEEHEILNNNNHSTLSTTTLS